ncbi:hypothetical protein GKO46_13105 [SAR202 cluster bacterium JH702]|uniref:Uncharacterized protein n=1 Tax=Candidatus Lucifugimonas marina TaxID=3038979 RepID=A0ABD4XTU0_9CHLR|nr:hypothetical protein [SAR202 cluster bacterium JH702]
MTNSENISTYDLARSRNLPHLLARFTEKWAPEEGTIQAHLDVLKSSGFVWIAKFGKSIGNSPIDRTNDEIGKRSPMFLVLMTVGSRELSDRRPRGGLFLLDEVRKKSEFSWKVSGIPAYYRKIMMSAGTWFKASKGIALSDAQLYEISIISSQSYAEATLRRSMASYFKVRISMPLMKSILPDLTDTSDGIESITRHI